MRGGFEYTLRLEPTNLHSTWRPNPLAQGLSGMLSRLITEVLGTTEDSNVAACIAVWSAKSGDLVLPVALKLRHSAFRSYERWFL
jgi:hypothetical protein